MTVHPSVPWKEGHDGPDWQRITAPGSTHAPIETGKHYTKSKDSPGTSGMPVIVRNTDGSLVTYPSITQACSALHCGRGNVQERLRHSAAIMLRGGVVVIRGDA